MTFLPGQSGNRAVGNRNKKTLAVEARLFDHAPELVDDLVARAKRGEPAAMRLCMERILPAGRGRPLPIELPSVRSTEDALAAAAVIMEALKEGAISAREAVDLLRVVEGLTRLSGAIDLIRKVARREVAKAAQTLGLDHFLAGPPAANDYARRMAEHNGDGEETADATDEDEYRSSQDPLYRCGDEHPPGAAHPENDRLQIVADGGPSAIARPVIPGPDPGRRNSADPGEGARNP